ncbi:MAG TPA: signal peptidase I [Candidatus Kapabacteria bacterium]|nr:signal peptidase I [Candidatus Kapabacteria bacterium]
MKLMNLDDSATIIEKITFRMVAEILIVICLVVFFLKIVVLDFFLVSSSSMEPTLYKKDILLVSRVSYFIGLGDRMPFIDLHKLANYRLNYKTPQKNDIIFFKNSFHSLRDYKENYLIKRVKLVPGDKLYYASVNGQLNFSKNSPDAFVKEYTEITIPAKDEIVNLDIDNIRFYKHIIENEDNKVEITANNIYINNKATNNYKFKENHYYVEGDNRNNSFDSRIYGLVPENVIFGKALLIIWSGAIEKDSYFDRFLTLLN